MRCIAVRRLAGVWGALPTRGLSTRGPQDQGTASFGFRDVPAAVRRPSFLPALSPPAFTRSVGEGMARRRCFPARGGLVRPHERRHEVPRALPTPFLLTRPAVSASTVLGRTNLCACSAPRQVPTRTHHDFVHRSRACQDRASWTWPAALVTFPSASWRRSNASRSSEAGPGWEEDGFGALTSCRDAAHYGQFVARPSEVILSGLFWLCFTLACSRVQTSTPPCWAWARSAPRRWDTRKTAIPN